VDAWSEVPGQAATVEHLRSAARAPVHAFLLVGPSGSGTIELALAFGAELLAADAAAEGGDVARAVELALGDRHPDLVVVGAEGATVRVEEAERLRDAALRTPVEGRRKVLVGVGFDVIQPNAAALLLKTVEEPPPSAVFVLVAEDVPPELVTIASRCLRVDVPPLGVEDVRTRLRAEAAAGALPTDRIDAAAEASGGDLDRARLLAADERLTLRRDAWLAVPGRLDGTGAAAHACAEDLLAMVDEVLAPLRDRQAAELAQVEIEAEAYGGVGRGARKALEERHKRQVRRVRSDELRYGLALLAGHYRDEVRDSPDPGPALEASERIGELGVALAWHNPNERLQLQALFARLGRR
jgi:DNA polymerase-3 subunit delta'